MNNSGSLLCCSYYGWELEGVHKRLYKIPWHCYQKESYPFHLMEADAEWQGDAKAMLGAVAFNAAAVIEEILQTWLYEETDMRRDVVLDADTHGGGPLERYAELFLLAVGVYVIYKVIHIESAVYRLF